jgi:DNA repair and recombination protein RAD52
MVGYQQKRRSVDDVRAVLEELPGPEYVSTRPGTQGKKFVYMEAHEVIDLLNEVVGVENWKTKMLVTEVDVCDRNEEGRFTVGVSQTLELELCLVTREGVEVVFSRQDCGYGVIENAPSKVSALEKCRKEAFTDALKRVARQFGKLLGNACYSKEYLAKIVTVRGDFEKLEFDVDRLHRKTVNVGKALIDPKKRKRVGVADGRVDWSSAGVNGSVAGSTETTQAPGRIRNRPESFQR